MSVKVAGRVESIDVDLGSVVKEGQVLAQLERREFELKLKQADAALQQARAVLGLPPEQENDRINADDTSTVREAKAVLDEAKKNRERLTALSKQGIIAEADVETAEAAYQVAFNKYQEAGYQVNTRLAMLAQRRAESEIARQQLADTTVKCPFDGVIQERRANRGEYLLAGAAIVSVVRINPIRLRLEIAERDAPSIKPNQRVTLISPVRSSAEGRIVRLSPAINQDSRMLVVEVDLPNDGALRPGTFARAEIIIDEAARGILLPRNSVQVFAGIEKVMVISNRQVFERSVTTGKPTADKIEVVKGLRAGETVLLDPNSARPGEAIQALE